jgi:hypothetical protein
MTTRITRSASTSSFFDPPNTPTPSSSHSDTSVLTPLSASTDGTARGRNGRATPAQDGHDTNRPDAEGPSNNQPTYDQHPPEGGPNLDGNSSGEPDIKTMLAVLMSSTSALQQYIMKQGTEKVETRAKLESPRVKEPDVFRGRRSEVNSFITQCLLVFSLQPNRFPTEDVKIRYELSLFRDAPLNAVQPHLLKERSELPAWLTSLDRLHEYIRTNYGDPDERGTAERKLQTLHQTGSASAYFAEFQQYSAILGWEDEPLVALATRGLSEYIKDLLAQRGKRITKMSELIEVVVTLDNRREERQREKKFQQQTHSTLDRSSSQISSRNDRKDTRREPASSNSNRSGESFTRSTFETRASLPTNQGRAGGGVRPPQGMTPTFRRLSEEEKAGRRARGECLRCGKTGHIANDCQTRNQQGYAPGLPTSAGQQRPLSQDQSKVSAPSK